MDGGDGNDDIRAFYGNDTLYGGDGHDLLIYQGLEASFQDGGAGNDKMVGASIGYGGDGDDIIYGNVIYGGSGNDVLRGGWIDTGSGNDIVDGGLTIHVEPGFGLDSVTQFDSFSFDDKIEFKTSVFANFAEVQAAMQQVGTDVVITKDSANTITLRGVSLADMTADDFTFV